MRAFRKMINTDSGKIACKRTEHVLEVTLSVYVPLVVLSVFLFIKYNYMALPVLLFVILSVIPFTKYIMIPLSKKGKKRIKSSVKNWQ